MARSIESGLVIARRAWCRGAGVSLLVAVAGLCGCTFTEPQKPGASERAQAPGALASRAPEQSLALTVDAYKRDVARHIYGSSTELLFDGAPPAQLRAVVVLSLRIDAEGRLMRVSVLRSNGYRELEEIALQSVRRAAPLPMPNRLVMRNGNADFVETWLFRDDGRFQIRSLAQEQASVDD